MKRDVGEFGRLLKQWRRVRNQSQLGLSLAAGVSAKHVAFIETGRARPSRDMVLTLAQTLEVPLRERNAMLRAAGFADVYGESLLDASNIAPVRRCLEFLLERHEPYPAMVIDGAWNLLLANGAARALFAAFAGHDAPLVPNALSVLFDPAQLRPYVQNWPEIAGHLLRRLRREALAAAGDAPIRRLLMELTALPGVSELLIVHRVDPSLPVVPLVLERAGLRLSLFSLVSSCGTAIDTAIEDIRIETLLPTDDATERMLRGALPRPAKTRL